MKNKLIFRILGALASALIIVSVFIPFVSVTGYTTSLWESFELTNSLYLPIMIIVFGAIGVIFFALNIKTEFAYMSTGAILFFLIMQTIDILNQNLFKTLSIGYYFLALGAILTGIMAFLTNLKSKNKQEKQETVLQATEPSMLDQIDKLYNEQTSVQNEISPMQTVDNLVQPIPVQSIETIAPVQPIEQAIPIVEEQSIPEVTPVQQVSTMETVQPQQIEQEPVQSIPVEPLNPVIQEFAQPINPTVQEFTNQESVQNPVVQEFTTQEPIQNQTIENFEPQTNMQPVLESRQYAAGMIIVK